MQESISIREMKDGEDDNGEFEDQDEDQDRSEGEIGGFGVGTNTPGSTPVQAGRKQMFAPDGGTFTSSRMSYAGSVQSPPVRGFAAMYLEEDEEGHLSAGAVTQLLRQLETESEEILFAVADLAHTRCAKLMGMRSEQSSKLLPAEIYKLLGLTWSFILQSELLSGYMCYGLRTAILSQVSVYLFALDQCDQSKAFLLQFHVKKTGQLAVAVGEDQWAPVSVPRSSQAIVDEIIAISTLSLHEARNKDFTMAFNILRLSTPPPPADGMDDQDSYIPSRLKSKGPSEAAAKNDNTSAVEVPDSPVLVVQEEMFRVVSSSLVLLDVLAEYLDILNNISALTTEVMQRIIEVLKLFNSRTCQVILGAGAMRSAGLKNITAKHLALASQSLSVIATLIPFIKDWIRAKMSDKQMVMLTEFDRILRDFQEHQNEIYAKLVAIMQERLSVHIRNLTNPAVVDYDALNRPAQQLADGGNVNTFMDLMVKEVTTLHKILCKFLPAASMRKVVDEVLQIFTTRLEEEIQKLPVATPLGKTRLQADMAYFGQKLGPFDPNGIIGTRLMKQVKELDLSDKKRGATAAPGTSASAPSASTGATGAAS
ncbi:hypothetical protein BGX34_001019 [Mortierella sp. NVP85]|nr:hypothetical protein BGX34_001019 [Mortierella sp. NVP85]